MGRRGGRRRGVAGHSIGSCASSTPTATSTRTGSPTTSSSCSGRPGSPASSGSSSRAGTTARRNGRSPSWPVTRGSTLPSAFIPTTPTRLRTRSGRSIEGWARRRAGRGDRGDGPRLGPDVLALGRPARQPATQPRASARDGQARHPPLSIEGRRPRRAGRPARRAAAGRVRRRESRSAFGERRARLIHSFSGPVDYAREVLAMGLAVSFSGLVFRAGEEASAEVAAIVPVGAPAGRDRRPVPHAPWRAPIAQRARVRRAHGALGRGATRGWREGPRGVRGRFGRRLRRHVSAGRTGPGRRSRQRLGRRRHHVVLLTDEVEMELDRLADRGCQLLGEHIHIVRLVAFRRATGSRRCRRSTMRRPAAPGRRSSRARPAPPRCSTRCPGSSWPR